MVGRQRDGRACCRQHSAHFGLYQSSLLLFREPWLQAQVCAFSCLKESEMCVQLCLGCTQDHRALPMSNKSHTLIYSGGRGVQKRNEQRGFVQSPTGRVGAEM